MRKKKGFTMGWAECCPGPMQLDLSPQAVPRGTNEAGGVGGERGRDFQIRFTSKGDLVQRLPMGDVKNGTKKGKRGSGSCLGRGVPEITLKR